MIHVTKNIFISESDIEELFIRSSGPGGQNVNKVATAVQLRFNLETTNLPSYIKENLRKIAKNKISSDGILTIEAKEHRYQDRNRKEALDRLISLIKQASVVPKKRFKTKPTRSSKENRLKSKKIRGEVKKGRGRINYSSQ